jgi:hypothetical protein
LSNHIISNTNLPQSGGGPVNAALTKSQPPATGWDH